MEGSLDDCKLYVGLVDMDVNVWFIKYKTTLHGMVLLVLFNVKINAKLVTSLDCHRRL